MRTDPRNGPNASSDVQGQRKSVASVHGYASAMRNRGNVATTPAATYAANASVTRRRGGWSHAAHAASTPRPAAGKVMSPAPKPASTPIAASVKAAAVARRRPPEGSCSRARAARKKRTPAMTKNARYGEIPAARERITATQPADAAAAPTRSSRAMRSDRGVAGEGSGAAIAITFAPDGRKSKV